MKTIILTSVLVFLLAATTSSAKQVVGFVEPVRVTPPGVIYQAKIDSGARISSLHATDIRVFKKDGKRWVTFKIMDEKDNPVELTLELVRIANIKRHKAASQKRPVVLLGLCLKNVYRQTQVNLIDRSRFKYRLLIGRDYLSGHFLIDPENEKTSRPECRER